MSSSSPSLRSPRSPADRRRTRLARIARLVLFIALPAALGWGVGRGMAMTLGTHRVVDDPAPGASAIPPARSAPSAPPGLTTPTPLTTPATPVHFTTWDIVLDSPQPIAAWQLRATPRDDSVRLVGIEGGSPPFAEPAAYDPAALAGGVVILAAYTLLPPAQLPDGAIAVATLHVRQRGETTIPPFAVALELAADADGNAIDARVELRRAEPSSPAP